MSSNGSLGGVMASRFQPGVYFTTFERTLEDVGGEVGKVDELVCIEEGT